MAIRRKSDAKRERIVCRYHAQMQHERSNQNEHEQRQFEFDDHDQLADCWCCCPDCTDLTWYYQPRKGVWWAATPSGGYQLMGETSVASPGSPETSPS